MRRMWIWGVAVAATLVLLTGCFPFHHWTHLAPGHCLVP